MTTTEIQTLTMDINQARTLANINRRAETLWADGYTADHFAGGLYHVHGPQGQHYMTMCDSIMGHHCDCPAFAKYNECKHHLAIGMNLNDEAQADLHDALYGDSDTDAYAEF